MSSSSTSSPAGEFGPNEWLVEEMYQRFLDDPSTVDPAWHEFFADYRPTDAAAADTADDSAGTGSVQQAAQQPGRPSPPSDAPTAPAPTPAAEPAEPSERSRAADRKALTPTTPPGGTNGSGPAVKRSEPARGAKPAAGSTSQAARPAARAADAGGTTTPLRGAAGAVVKNMNASLAVPTATSVRAVPAKLLADNRVVINNQLRRTRGGKVSFTHLIGYALVKALADFPVMNRHYSEQDGKPVVVQPDHVNLGLAIDLPGKDGQRSLVVVSIKGCEAMNFAQFWAAYEAMVHKARAGALQAEDFAGTTITLTNPGTLGTNHSVPRLMQGQGAIIGVGAMEYPRSSRGRATRSWPRSGSARSSR